MGGRVTVSRAAEEKEVENCTAYTVYFTGPTGYNISFVGPRDPVVIAPLVAMKVPEGKPPPVIFLSKLYVRL